VGGLSNDELTFELFKWLSLDGIFELAEFDILYQLSLDGIFELGGHE